jgi:hypothetical protein
LKLIAKIHLDFDRKRGVWMENSKIIAPGNQKVDFNRLSLKEFRDFFSTLAIPDPAALPGTYRAAFVGPGWLRSSAGPSLALSGLGGWWGKEIHADGTAINIVLRRGTYSKRFPMKFVTTSSLIDARQGLALYYQPGNPFPWMYVVDEIRTVAGKTLLGMTIANVRGLRKLAFPFILEKTE